jgi:hypothetical protein
MAPVINILFMVSSAEPRGGGKAFREMRLIAKWLSFTANLGDTMPLNPDV